jgi:[acyl-carrier-protein] S-malonyltransferase
MSWNKAMTKTAWIFPGQGSQAVGMGIDLLESAVGAQRYQQAESILGWSVPERCRGDLATLSRTLYTQPCLYVISAILADLLKEQGQQPSAVSGHSLGEYAALYVAEAIDFESGLKLVKRRAELMEEASGGKMVALMGFDREAVDAQIRETADVVLANDNHADQVVISGSPAAVDTLLTKLKFKKSLPLRVSGAFHSPLMVNAAADFNEVLKAVAFQTAKIPVLSNVEPSPATNASELQARLSKQMVGPVRWREICLKLQEMGVERVVEVGPGKVLTGLVKRTCPEMSLSNRGSLADLSH